MNEQSTPQPTRKERETERYRCEILDAAVRLFAEHGYHETTMQMIADAAEFSVGYLYKHFPGKEDMYREMVVYHMAVMDEVIAEIEAKDLGPLDELRTTYEAICDHFNHHRDFMRIYHQRLDEGVTELLERKEQHFEKMVEAFTRSMEAGEIRKSDPRLLATVVHGATQELFHELAERDVERPFDDLTDVIFTLIIDPLRI